MSEFREIWCDNCERDITKTSNSIAYRLRLCDEIIPSHDGAVTDMMTYPHLPDGECHFCNLKCLIEWAKK